jgi:hypothetical protein
MVAPGYEDTPPNIQIRIFHLLTLQIRILHIFSSTPDKDIPPSYSPDKDITHFFINS